MDDEEANKDLKEGEERKTKSVPETTQLFERQNTVKPIWLRSPKDVNDTEYTEFYKTAFKMSYDEPMKHTHFSLEGNVEMKSVLCVRAKARGGGEAGGAERRAERIEGLSGSKG